MDPTQLYLAPNRKVLLPDGSLDPAFWRFLTDLQVGLSTVDLTTQVTGVLPLVNGGTGDSTGAVPASGLTGSTLAAGVIASSLTSVGTLGSLAVSGNLTGMADVYSVDFTDYAGTSTIIGWSSFTANKRYIFYKTIGKLVWVSFVLSGTSNSTSVSFTLPITAVSTTGLAFTSALGVTFDNGVAAAAPGVVRLLASSNTVHCYVDNSEATNWTASGTKNVEGQFFFQAA